MVSNFVPTAGKGDGIKNACGPGRLRTLMGNHTAHATRTDNQDVRHVRSFVSEMRQ